MIGTEYSRTVRKEWEGMEGTKGGDEEGEEGEE